MSNPKKNRPLDIDKLMVWPFPDQQRSYDAADAIRFAEGFGVGLAGEMQEADQRFIAADLVSPLPFIAVPLADGEFWQAEPDTGIVWQQMIHAGESITIHKRLPNAAELTLSQGIDKIYDRGAERGATMVQRFDFHGSDQAADNPLYVSLEVITILRANGGFDGEPDTRPNTKWVPQERPADSSVVVATPKNDNAVFEMTVDLAVAGGVGENQRPLRGVCSFGLAGRAALYLLCGNDPTKLKHFSVRYAGMLFTDETVKVEIWYLEKGKAALRMTAVEREKLVLNHCLVEFDAD